MIQVTLGTNLERKNIIVDGATTLRKLLEDNDFDYSTGILYLDASPLRPGDLDKSFNDLGIVERCILTKVVKADNA